MKKSILLFLLIGSYATLPAQQKNDRSVLFDGMTGTWYNEAAKNFERWTKIKPGLYHADAYTVKGKDTSYLEHARIFPENGKWIFANTVKGQNNGKEIKFIATRSNDNMIQFSNPKHDFPNDINYTLKDKNNLTAFIVGKNPTGGRDTLYFRFKRVK